MPRGFQTAGLSHSPASHTNSANGQRIFAVQTAPMCEEIGVCYSQKAFLAVKVLGNPLTQGVPWQIAP